MAEGESGLNVSGDAHYVDIQEDPDGVVFVYGPDGLWRAFSGEGIIACAGCFGDLLKQVGVRSH